MKLNPARAKEIVNELKEKGLKLELLEELEKEIDSVFNTYRKLLSCDECEHSSRRPRGIPCKDCRKYSHFEHSFL